MRNHPNRSGRTGMSRPSYLAMARRLRHYADLIEANASPETPQQKRTLTQTISNVSSYARRQSCRHHGRPLHGSPDDKT